MHDTDTERLTQFLRDYYRSEIGELARHYPSEQRSLYVSHSDLFRFDPELADAAIERPRETRERLEEALYRYDLPVDVDLSDAHVRLCDLEKTHEVSEVSRTQNIGNLLDVSAQVAKVSTVKPRVERAAFDCVRCGTQTLIAQSGDELTHPHECEGCERQGPFDFDPVASDWIDHQYARLQQPPERTRGGDGQEVDAHLKDDLIEQFDAGDRVTLTGVLDVEDPNATHQRRSFDTQLSAAAVRREESDYDDIEVDPYREQVESIASGERGDPYELLVKSVNPKHRGDETVKLAIALQLFGGWPHEYPDGSRDRGDWHQLLIGDPGCGKSTFLRWVDEMAPRSTYASGKGASAAGMTAAAVSDDFGDTEWSLEAGALVLADGGVACVDEIDKMQSDAVSSMHDALESQQVHINKAGINATLSARTALLAAGNPEEGRFDSYRPKGQQIDLGPTLLSRFDLIFLVSDEPTKDGDREVVEHMTRSRTAAAKYTLDEQSAKSDRERIEPAIPQEVLRAYIAHARETCFPVIRHESVEDRLTEFFVDFRAGSGGERDDSPVPLTFRKVEALHRLAESSARVRLSDTVEIQDIERAIDLVMTSMRQVGYDPENSAFDADVTETGEPESQRDRKRQLLAIVDDLEQDSANGASLDEVYSLTDDLNLDRDIVEHDIRELKSNGRIYSVGSNCVRRS